jgi:hypothetical protein
LRYTAPTIDAWPIQIKTPIRGPGLWVDSAPHPARDIKLLEFHRPAG